MYQRPGPCDLPVSVDEIAFAMTLFVEAASLDIPNNRTDLRILPTLDFSRVYDAVTAEISSAIAANLAPASSPGTIDFPFQMLWQHYEGDPRRASICARVLGFHSLMLQTRGALVESCLHPCTDRPDSVILDPIVVEAVAQTPLGPNGVMSSADFQSTLTALKAAH